MKRQIKLIITLLLIAMIAMTLSSCKAKESATKSTTTQVAAKDEAKSSDEGVSEYNKLMERENAILSDNTSLWEKVYLSADKNLALSNVGNNYGEFLLATIESAKDKFTSDELAILKKSAEEIRDIENKLAMLEEKYPKMKQSSDEGYMSVPAENTKMERFPSFVGKDLDGNDINSDELFGKNAVTVVNFWFTTCKPCVGELSELDELNKKLQGKGGSLIGINTFTLDGQEDAIKEAKDVLEKKGANYQNVYFASDSEAGDFTSKIFAYPTTYVVDRYGNIIGDPIVGAITNKKQAETLENYINMALQAESL